MYEHVGRYELGTLRARGDARYCVRADSSSTTGSRAFTRPRTDEPDRSSRRYVFPDGELHPLADLMSAIHGRMTSRSARRRRRCASTTCSRCTAGSANLERQSRRGDRSRRPERERAWRLYMLGLGERVRAGEITVYQVLAARGRRAARPAAGPPLGSPPAAPARSGAGSRRSDRRDRCAG